MPSLFELFDSSMEVITGPADRAVHYHIGEADATLATLQRLIGMSPEAYAAWVYGDRQPGHNQDQEAAPQGTSDLVTKHSELLATTQADWAANQATVARDAADAAQTFGRFESAGGSPAIEAIPRPPVDQQARWN